MSCTDVEYGTQAGNILLRCAETDEERRGNHRASSTLSRTGTCRVVAVERMGSRSTWCSTFPPPRSHSCRIDCSARRRRGRRTRSASRAIDRHRRAASTQTYVLQRSGMDRRRRCNCSDAPLWRLAQQASETRGAGGATVNRKGSSRQLSASGLNGCERSACTVVRSQFPPSAGAGGPLSRWWRGDSRVSLPRAAERGRHERRPATMSRDHLSPLPAPCAHH